MKRFKKQKNNEAQQYTTAASDRNQPQHTLSIRKCS
jgi:hypothetical protein